MTLQCRGNITSQDDDLYKFMKYYNRVGITLYIIYVIDNPECLILALVIRYNEILKEIISVVFKFTIVDHLNFFFSALAPNPK